MESSGQRSRLRLVPASRWPSWPHWAVIVVAAWLALGGLAHYLSKATGSTATACLFKRVTTVPCPTCGFGRGSDRLLHGDLVGALTFNPLLFSLIFFGGALLTFRLLTARRVTVTLSRRARLAAWVAFLALAGANWAYLITRGI